MATYASRACEKLRKQVRVSIRIGMFSLNEAMYAKGIIANWLIPPMTLGNTLNASETGLL